MSSPGLLWTILVPIIAGALGTLLLAGQRQQRLTGDYAPWLRLGGLLAVCAGLMLEAVFLAFTPDTASTTLLGVVFDTSAPARYVLTAANVSLLCAALFYWTSTATNDDLEPQKGRVWIPLGLGVLSTLLTCIGLASDRLVAALLLFVCALIVAMIALPVRNTHPKAKLSGTLSDPQDHEIDGRKEAKRYTAALKHVSLAIIAAALWIGGAAIIDRYAFNLENRGLLQFGIGLFAVGLLVWVGSMPFAASWGDLIEAAPTAAIVALGAVVPVALISGLLLLAPVEGTLARGAAAGWLGAVGAFLAGLRALAMLNAKSRMQSESIVANLKAITIAAAVSWAVYGVLSGSQTGAIGGILIATNIALSVPLLMAGGRWIVRVGVLALIGLPPFGAFGGMLLVAQSAANAGGFWLGLLMSGSGLVGAAWLANRDLDWSPATAGEETEWRQRLTDPVLLLTLALSIAQVAFFALSATRLIPLINWAQIPWLTAP